VEKEALPIIHAIRFRNRTGVPFTTAPASVYEKIRVGTGGSGGSNGGAADKALNTTADRSASSSSSTSSSSMSRFMIQDKISFVPYKSAATIKLTRALNLSAKAKVESKTTHERKIDGSELNLEIYAKISNE
jgi:hypothetical protein